MSELPSGSTDDDIRHTGEWIIRALISTLLASRWASIAIEIVDLERDAAARDALGWMSVVLNSARRRRPGGRTRPHAVGGVAADREPEHVLVGNARARAVSWTGYNRKSDSLSMKSDN